MLVAACVLLVVGGCSSASSSSAASRPNIVFVLTDDFSLNLVQYMPHVLQLQKDGTTFSNYTVTDSLCCPSRSSIFAGKPPHDTGVFTNTAPDGGFKVFHGRGEESETFATDLQKVGYRTAMMGKYLNGYQPTSTLRGSQPYVPPGWTEWDVAGKGYGEFNYDLNENHQVKHYGKAPADYLTDVLSAKGQDFITSSTARHSPFFLEIATFTPHAPYVPAPQDANSFPGLRAPRTPAFDTPPATAPAWLANRPPLTAQQQDRIDTIFRKRVQDVQSVDRMIGAIQATLSKAGVAGDTDVVFSSDNGYHLGEYRLPQGKMTAFDTDVHVPLVAAGPGIRSGQVVSNPVLNTDLRPTFEQLGGAPTPPDVDGHTLLPLLAGQHPSDWRTAAVVEHHGPDTDRTDPDLPGKNGANPPTYNALRTDRATYVEYADGAKEYYDRAADPDELHNTVSSLSPTDLSSLHNSLAAMTGCHGGASCWKADHLAQ
ncbi:MAG: sulfatase [Pseudonocardia sp.]|nr:sulfatase [Pseudonocardia sp.]